MIPLSSDLQKIFERQGLDFENVPKGIDSGPRPLVAVLQSSQKPTKRPVGQEKVISLLYYFLKNEQLKSKEKVLLLLVADAHLRGSICQVSIRALCQFLGHARATVFRVLNRLEPGWMKRDGRPGKTSILKPGPLLLCYIKRAGGKGFKQWIEPRSRQPQWMNRFRPSSGMSRPFQHI